MTEILTMIGIENLSYLMIFISICAILTSLITEAIKGFEKVNELPTKLVCYGVALALTTPAFCALMAFMKQPVEWFMVFASFLASFVVAKVSMSGWDDLNELADRLLHK